MEDRRPLTDRVRCKDCGCLVPVDKTKLAKHIVAAAIDDALAPAKHDCNKRPS